MNNVFLYYTILRPPVELLARRKTYLTWLIKKFGKCVTHVAIVHISRRVEIHVVQICINVYLKSDKCTI
jgi:hypothetical protein